MNMFNMSEDKLEAKHAVEQAAIDAYIKGFDRTEIEVMANKAIDDYEKGLGATNS